MERERTILIAGPTASGKSALALGLAERLGGMVINADSMAVYRDLSILTGRPGAEDLARAPHRLYGHHDAPDAYSVGRWLAEVVGALDETRRSGLVPIVVGGTGLYFKALVQGLSDIPAVPPALRARLRAECEDLSPGDLHARLTRSDPETASRLRPTDPQRVMRALEVFEATGRPLAAFQAVRQPPVLREGDWRGVVIAPERGALQDAIDRRFDAMMAAGAEAEVRLLARRGLDRTLPAMRALGVRPLLAYCDGLVGLDAAVARAKAETRAYAKRQMTFARHQLAGFRHARWQDAEQALAA